MNLIYALKDNILVHVDSVNNGKNCGCKCPSCNENLIAKNLGKIKDHHFAHHGDGDCAGAFQTQLHLLAKDIFLEQNSIKLPSYTVELDEFMEIKIKDEYEFKVKSVYLEKRVQDIIPDIVVIDDENNQLMIEIKVTHGIDDIKREKIKKLNLNCIEIVLDNFILKDKEDLKKVILTDLSMWHWRFCKNQSEIIGKFKQSTEMIPLKYIGQTLHTNYCPSKKIKVDNTYTANYQENCKSCPFNLGVGKLENQIICGGKVKLSSIKQINKFRDVLKKDDQIIQATNEIGEIKDFPTYPDLQLFNVLELWDGYPMLIKNLATNVTFRIKKDPNMMNAKYHQVYGDMYKNGQLITANTRVHYFYDKVWYKIENNYKTWVNKVVKS